MRAVQTVPSRRTRNDFSSSEIDPQGELVKQAKAGNAEAFGHLYETYLDRIYRYIYFRVTDQQTAEDLISQVFTKAWENLDRYQPSGRPFIAWLYTIAHNTVIDHYRTRKDTVAIENTISLASDAPGPHEQVELHIEADHLRAALQTLTAEQQQVVMLKFIAGMTTDEIAGQLRKSAGAIRALQMRALEALAKQMDKNEVFSRV
ncbi:MAG TPA: sigma-70 family RNA polymerase sigma factor [Anaerolineales bacterium]|nr:sigma-70 family RNA polymerase sigma factor [Anaerolineales bacterium]